MCEHLILFYTSVFPMKLSRSFQNMDASVICSLVADNVATTCIHGASWAGRS